jgi:DNA polymerase III gamma/tau subunit
VIGYTDTIEQLKNQFTAGRVPTALKFVGVSRGGKTTLARIVAMSVNCTHGEFGEPCDACLENADFEINEMNAAAFGKAGSVIARAIKVHDLTEPVEKRSEHRT